jgi:hypothetical protein
MSGVRLARFRLGEIRGVRIVAVIAVLLGGVAFGLIRGSTAYAATYPLPKADSRAVSPDRVIVGTWASLILAGDQADVLESVAFPAEDAFPGQPGSSVVAGRILWPIGSFTIDPTVLWSFDPTGIVGLYRVRHNYSGFCLDADNSHGGGNGTRVQTWTCMGNGQVNQLWWLVSDLSGRVRLVSDWNGRCLDLDNRFGGRDGSVFQLWDCLGDGQNMQTNQWFNVIEQSLYPRPPYVS